MDHSARFHALMDTIMPDNAERRRALREAVAPGAAF
jgi:predicted metal-dependent hydrolase